jgi:MSHA pilin protein MshA
MKNISKQQGFTLIELIVVIVILGILAVTAAPKFISFTGDANKAAVNGVKGGIASAMTLIYAKAAIDGNESYSKTAAAALTPPATAGGATLAFGYPSADVDGIVAAIALSTDTKSSGTTAKEYTRLIVGSTIYLAPSGKMSNGAADAVAADFTTTSLCYILYSEATGTTAALSATVTVVDSGCGA